MRRCGRLRTIGCDERGGVVSEATRHVMQANKSKNTKPELRVRAALREAGLSGYRLHWKKAPGKPDICYPGRKVAIFVHGCYWHHCPHCAMPTPRSNVAFWEAKFSRNRARDQRDCAQLVEAGWTVLVVWECRLKKARFEATMRELVHEIRRASGEGCAPAPTPDAGEGRTAIAGEVRAGDAGEARPGAEGEASAGGCGDVAPATEREAPSATGCELRLATGGEAPKPSKPQRHVDFAWARCPSVVEIGFMPAWRKANYTKRVRMRHSR